MKLSPELLRDIATACDLANRDTSPIWLQSTANLYDHIAERIRAEIAAQPSPDFPPVE